MTNAKAVFKKEFYSYFNSLLAYIFIGVFVLIISWLYFQSLFLYNQATMRNFFGLMPWFFLFLVPAIAMKSWAEEKSQGTIENLLTLPIKEWQAVLAKFLAGFAFLGVALLFTIPIPLTLSFIGNLDWGPIIGSYLGAWLMAGAYFALGQWISALTKNQIVAFILTLLGCFAFMIIGLPFVIQIGGWPATVLSSMSTYSHFMNLSKGVILLRDVVYYISFIFIFLYLNYYSLLQRHWK